MSLGVSPTRPSIPAAAWLAAGMWAGIAGAESHFAAAHGQGGQVGLVLAAGLLASAAGALSWSRLRWGALALAVAGLVSGAFVGSQYLRAWGSTAAGLSRAGSVETVCVAVGDSRDGTWGPMVTVQPDGADFGGFDITLTLDDGSVDLGTEVSVTGSASVPEVGTPEERRAWRSGVAAYLRPWRTERLGWRSGALGAVARYRSHLARRLHADGGVGSALMAGVLLGDRRGLRGAPVETDFRVAGLSHLLAVSGLHLGLVSIGMGWLLRALRAPRAVQASGVLAAALAFAALTGFQVSTSRALCMVVIAWLGSLSGRRGDALGALSLTVCLVLMHRPMAAFDVSLRLSVCAVGGLLLFGDLAGAWVQVALGVRVLARSLAATLVAQAGTWPVIASTFHAISLVAPLGNLVAIPLASAGLACGLGAALVPLPVARDALLAAGTSLLEACASVARACGGLAGAAVTVGSPSFAGLTAWALATAVVWVRWPVPRGRASAVAALGVLIAAHVAVGIGAPTRKEHLVVLDVGQADALLLEDGGESMLVDCGAYPRDIQAAMGRHGVRELDSLVLTHAHDDHTGGLEGLIGVVSVGWVGGPATIEDPFGAARSRVARLRPRGEVAWVELSAGDSWSIGATSVTVLWPSGPDPGADTNDTSVVLLLERDGFVAALGADAEEGVWRELASTGALPDIDALKVSHHGSHNGVEAAALDAMKPEIALVSVGEDNRFGHPSPEAIEMLQTAGAVVWRTDRHGDLEVSLEDVPVCRSDRER